MRRCFKASAGMSRHEETEGIMRNDKARGGRRRHEEAGASFRHFSSVAPVLRVWCLEA